MNTGILHSAGSLIHKINKEHYELIFIGISKDGKWYAYDGDVDGIEHDTWLCEEHCTPCVLSSSEGCRGFLKLHADGPLHALRWIASSRFCMEKRRGRNDSGLV